jgi:hypothetical protein
MTAAQFESELQHSCDGIITVGLSHCLPPGFRMMVYKAVVPFGELTTQTTCQELTSTLAAVSETAAGSPLFPMDAQRFPRSKKSSSQRRSVFSARSCNSRLSTIY